MKYKEMTKEIALHCMKSASELKSELCEECPIYGQTGSDHCFEDALQYVIGILEQEPVLDRLRAEIKKEIDRDDHADEYCDGYYDGMRNDLAIIDKYKAESEPQESKSRVPLTEIEKAYESIMDVAEGGYVDIEEIKVHFCKWLGIEDK